MTNSKSASNLHRRNIKRHGSNLSHTSDTDGDETDEAVEEKYQPKPVSLRSVGIRAIVASILALFFLGLLQAGHFYCILLG